MIQLGVIQENLFLGAAQIDHPHPHNQEEHSNSTLTCICIFSCATAFAASTAFAALTWRLFKGLTRFVSWHPTITGDFVEFPQDHRDTYCLRYYRHHPEPGTGLHQELFRDDLVRGCRNPELNYRAGPKELCEFVINLCV